MEALEDALSLVTARSLMSLCRAESEAAWAVVQSDLTESHRSGAYVNIDGNQVRMMFKSDSPIWYGSYEFPSDQLVSALKEIATELSAGGNQLGYSSLRTSEPTIDPAGFIHERLRVEVAKALGKLRDNAIDTLE